MLIDSNAYIGHWPFRQYKYSTSEALLRRMEAFGTDKSIISNLNGIFYKDTQLANEELFNIIQGRRIYRNRFIPFAVINPIYAGWRNDFIISITKLGMKGIRIYPKYHRYKLTNPSCIELVKMCRDEGIPVSLSLRMVDSRTSSWIDIEKEWRLKDVVPLVKAVPDAKYLILNLANSTALSEEEYALFKQVDLLMDTSGRFMEKMMDLFERFGTEKFCFGTQSPILDYASGLLRIEALREDEVGEDVKNLLRYRNLERMMKI